MTDHPESPASPITFERDGRKCEVRVCLINADGFPERLHMAATVAQLAQAGFVPQQQLTDLEHDLLDIAESTRGDWTSRTEAGGKAQLKVSALLDQLTAANTLASELCSERDHYVHEANRLGREALVANTLASEQRERAVEAERKLAGLQAHFDAAAPEHNLPALLDLYHDRLTAERAKREHLERASRLLQCVEYSHIRDPELRERCWEWLRELRDQRFPAAPAEGGQGLGLGCSGSSSCICQDCMAEARRRSAALNCYCSDYLSSGVPCSPGKCPNVPKAEGAKAAEGSEWVLKSSLDHEAATRRAAERKVRDLEAERAALVEIEDAVRGYLKAWNGTAFHSAIELTRAPVAKLDALRAQDPSPSPVPVTAGTLPTGDGAGPTGLDGETGPKCGECEQMRKSYNSGVWMCRRCYDLATRGETSEPAPAAEVEQAKALDALDKADDAAHAKQERALTATEDDWQEVEQAAGTAKGESIKCSFCLGSWPIVEDGMVAMIRGPEACICQNCVWQSARIASEHAEKYEQMVKPFPPPASPVQTSEGGLRAELIEAIHEALSHGFPDARSTLKTVVEILESGKP